MSKVFYANGLCAQRGIMYHLIFLLASLNTVWAGILIYDGDLGIEEFHDVEMSNTEPISRDGIMGAIVAASPIDACSNISKPPNMNITNNWFVLIAGNSSCSFEVKVLNAKYAGYAVAVLYISETRIPHFIKTQNGYYSFFPNISAVVIGSEQGRIIRENYLFEVDQRFRVYIFPNNTFSIMTFLLLFSIVTGLFLVVMLVFAVIRFFQHSSSVQRGRLSSRHLKQLQTSRYNKGDGSDSCAICLEEYKDQDKLRFLPCSHGYHARCIDPWLTNNRPICPVCKQKVVLEGHNSDNARDLDFDERSETTPLLQDRRETQHGTFNLIYNPEGENVGDLNLPCTSVSKNTGRVRALRQSVSGPGDADSSNNSVTENFSGNNVSKDSAPKNIGIIKRLVFLKNSSLENPGSSNVSNPPSNNTSSSTENLNVTDLPGEPAIINIADVDLSKISIIGIDLLSNPGSTNLSSDAAVANIDGVNLPSDSITGYVAGTNLSEFWPSDHLDKIKLSDDSLSRNQDGLNLSSNVSVNLGVANLSNEANVNLGGDNISSKSAAIGDINLPNKSVSVNLDGINLSGKSDVANLGDINVSTSSGAANIGGITVPSDSVPSNLGGVNIPSDLIRTDLDGIIAATANFEAPRSPTATKLGARVSNEALPVNLGVNLTGKGLAGNFDGSDTSSSVSITANLEGVNVSSPISEKFGDVNVSSPTISANLGGVNVSSPPVDFSQSHISVTSPLVDSNLRAMSVSSDIIPPNPGINVSSDVEATNLDINVSSDVAPTNLGINLSTGSTNRRRHRNFK